MSAQTEVAATADFSRIRYAQCWEDADVLLAGLQVKPGARVLSIASAGDNCFSLLAAGASHVMAVDMNPAQIACVELRKAAYACLSHSEFLQLMGSRAATADNRQHLFERCLSLVPHDSQAVWKQLPNLEQQGLGSLGKFENYFRLFREKALPWVHSRKKVAALFVARNSSQREAFYESSWNTWRWRGLFKLFFSRRAMGRLGRDPRFFKYVEGSVADRILSRTRHALVALDPCENPYLHWILNGTHGEALPHALREENYATIRQNLHRLEVRLASVEQILAAEPAARYDAFNLSDIFEYMSESWTETLYGQLLAAANPGARLLYWNMLVPRQCPVAFRGQVQRHEARAAELLAADKAFFYSALQIEEVMA